MNINATIIVQALHFLCAYGIIRVIFLKPAVREIQSDDNERVQLHQAIIDTQKHITHLENEHMQLWKSCQDYFKLNKPVISPAIFRYQENIPAAPYIPSENEVRDMIDHFKLRIVQKLGTPYDV